MIQTKEMPPWVYWGLLGTQSRKMALAMFSLSILMALILVPEAFISGRFIFLGFAPLPIWYWMSIDWVDNHGRWH